MSEVLMTLGTLRFSVADGAFQRLQRRLEMRVAKLERAGRQSARQILGEDETVEIEGVVFTAQRGLGRLDAMRALARSRVAQTLTDGMGNVWGSYVIEQVDEDAGFHLPNGAPLRQGFRMTLGLAGTDA